MRYTGCSTVDRKSWLAGVIRNVLADAVTRRRFQVSVLAKSTEICATIG